MLWVMHVHGQWMRQWRVVRPPVRSNGRSYKMLVMFSLFSTRILRPPSTDHRETSPHDRSLCLFYKLTPKIREPSPAKKIGGQKHAKFRSILYNLRLWSRISPERLKISKIWKLIDRRQFRLHYMKLDGHGRARREAARRRKSECKINFRKMKFFSQ